MIGCGKNFIYAFTIKPIVTAAITVPSLMPEMFLNAIREITDAITTNVTSITTFTFPNFFSVTVATAFTMPSPGLSTTFAISAQEILSGVLEVSHRMDKYMN